MASSASPKPKLRSSRKLSYGATQVIEPKGDHLATIAWLHGRGDNGLRWARILRELPLKNIKWIVPTAPMQSITAMGGYCCNAWFDGRPTWDGPEDLEGLDASAAHIVELLSGESPQVKLGVGGFSQGAATSLYLTACSIIGSFSDGTTFPCRLEVTASLSGWLPSVKNTKMHFLKSPEAATQAKGYPVFLGHGINDDIVPIRLSQESLSALGTFGFNNITFKSYKGVGHRTNVEEFNDLYSFLKEWLHLQG